MESTSATLLERVRDPRDAAAWRQFFGLYSPLLKNYARRYGLGASDAEEVAQECMKRLAERMGDFRYSRDRGRFKNFLRKMVNNLVANHRRRKRPRQARTGELERLASSEMSRDAWEQVWLQEHLAYCLKAMESRYSTATVHAFRLYALQNWPVERVCERVGISANQVYLAKSRMIRRLRIEVTRFVGDVL